MCSLECDGRFLVKGKEDNKRYARKQVKSTDGAKRAVQSEAIILQTCNHPHIVRFVDVSTDTGPGPYTCFIVMELANKSLGSVIRCALHCHPSKSRFLRVSDPHRRGAAVCLSMVTCQLPYTPGCTAVTATAQASFSSLR
jgi:serine/threonine protein kinase